MCQQHWLGVAGEIDLIIRIFERELRHVVSQHIARLFIDQPGCLEIGVQIAADSRVLGTLTRKNENNALFVIRHGITLV